ncbi:MAG: PAS domain-containing protein, partial [Anaerolineales bacterium]|nr:PAS domain-containing protein [Anaerolineales bacterium]
MTASRLGRSLSLISGLSTARNDERYRLLTENLGQAVLFVTLPGHRISDANLRALQLTGYSRQDLCASVLSDLFPGETEPDILQDLSMLDPGVTRYFASVPLCTHAGETVYVKVRAARGSKITSVLLLLLSTDTSLAATQVESTVAGESERALHALAALISMLRTPATAELENTLPLCHNFLEADDVALYSATPQPGFELLVATGNVFPATLDATDTAVGPALFEWRAGTPVSSEISRTARDQGYGLLLSHPLGDRVGGCGVLVSLYRSGNNAAKQGPARIGPTALTLTLLIDLQGQIQASQAHALRQDTLEQHWAALLQATGDGIVTVRSNGEIESINATAERLLGYKQSEVAAMQLPDVLVGDQPVAGKVLAALRKGEAYGGTDITLVRRDGREVHVLLRAMPVRGHEKANGAGLIAIRDHSEHKAMEAKAQQLDQRTLLDDLAPILAHEIRNPLNGITTGLHYLQMQLGSEDGLQESVESILGEAKRISRLLQKLQLYLKRTELVIEPTEVGKFLRALSGRWRERLQSRGISIDIEVDEDTPLALADTSHMEQVFTNLFSNAMHAMESEGGAVTVAVQPAPPQAEMRGEHVQINIGDTGPGMPPDVLERVFTPFYTTKQEGTGLG